MRSRIRLTRSTGCCLPPPRRQVVITMDGHVIGPLSPHWVRRAIKPNHLLNMTRGAISPSAPYKRYRINSVLSNGANLHILFFCRLYPFSPSYHGTVRVLPVISLLLINTVSPVRACLTIWWERFVRTQEEDDRGPLTIQSYLVLPLLSSIRQSLWAHLDSGELVSANTYLSLYWILYEC